jgi:AraC-like DNA-binding protein
MVTEMVTATVAEITTPVTRVLASGPGWSAADVLCTCGPQDRPFEERHADVCIAAVTAGTFHYRATHGSAVLVPGALLLGNHEACFECGHEHSSGDRCLSFHFAPDFVADVMASVPGARKFAFPVPRLPPLPALLPVIAAAEAARDDGDADEFEELALCLAGAVTATLVDSPSRQPAPRGRDDKRIASALRLIEAQAHEHDREPLSLASLADAAAMSPYHFLRTFRGVVGMTPHQFILHTRLRCAAVRLRRSADDVSAIALDCGFNDLSTFNRRFKRLMGASPRAYRASRRG